MFDFSLLIRNIFTILAGEVDEHRHIQVKKNNYIEKFWLIIQLTNMLLDKLEGF
jgi:hypothetical protein